MDISTLEQFDHDRTEGNDLVMKYAGLQLKRLSSGWPFGCIDRNVA